jgi:hypothetical protein
VGNAMADIPEMENQIRAMAKREAWYHGIDNPTAVGNIVESVRYREFRRAIEPYERFRNKPIFDWLSLQARPCAPQPDWLIESTRLWDELIAGIARKYGYTSDTATEPK